MKLPKNLLTTLFLLIFFNLNYSNTLSSANNLNVILFPNKIEDGWYEATVKYTNYKTGKYATYNLNVKVEYDKVTTIDFGNGGSVHSGYNNEGYIYSGGYISLEKDFSGNVIAATTTVSISDSNGMRNFKIRIE